MLRISNGVKYILWANIILFALEYVLGCWDIRLDNYLALYYVKSPYFKPMQFITYMFMHGGIMHIFFNMFALIQFGSAIESIWGIKRFTFYYMATGIGAGLINMVATHLELSPFLDAVNSYFSNPTPDTLESMANTSRFINPDVVCQWADIWRAGKMEPQAIIDESISQIQDLMNKHYLWQPMVGASGAIFGLLLAFGMMFPNLKLQIMFIPIDIPAKYFVALYGVIELVFGINDFQWDNVAHYAHLGGMLIGLMLMLWWKKNPHNELFN